MRYDRGVDFPFDFEQNGFPFGSKSKGKLSARSYPIQCERKWKYSFLSAEACEGITATHATCDRGDDRGAWTIGHIPHTIPEGKLVPTLV